MTKLQKTLTGLFSKTLIAYFLRILAKMLIINKLSAFSKIKQNILRITTMVFFLNCGINTDTPTTPYIFLIPINIPQIAGLYPIDSATSTDFSYVEPILNSPKPQFILKYYVTNTEQQFVGYNLYITATTPSLAETQLGANAYLENGVSPSFTHLATESSTES